MTTARAGGPEDEELPVDPWFVRPGQHAHPVVGVVPAGAPDCRCSSVPEATPCTSEVHLVFEPGGAAFDLRAPSITVEPADGGFGLGIFGGLPSSGPWSRSEGGAGFGISVERYVGPGPATGTAMLAYRVEEPGLMGNRSLRPTWEGRCDLVVGERGARTTFRCELSGDASPGARLTLTGDVPAPESIPVAELRATYRATLELVLEQAVP